MPRIVRQTFGLTLAMALVVLMPVAHAGQAISQEPSPVVRPGEVDARVKITEGYARLVARDAYFWAWPMVNMYNRNQAAKRLPKPVLLGGIAPVAPLNRLAMLTDYIKPEQRAVACPNQDVIYGGARLDLDATPVVLQVPDFGSRFWVYQVSNLRTDSFAGLGAMHGTKPGFYMIVGPGWSGTVPEGIEQVLRSDTASAFIGVRVFQDDTAQDNQAVQAVIQGINLYPLAEYDGKVKRQDWSSLPLQSIAANANGGETRWVRPETFFEQLPLVLRDAPPLPGESANYAQVQAVIEAARKNPALKDVMVQAAIEAERELIDPLLQFRNWGLALAHNWTTLDNGARFGTDYFMRTAVAKSNMLVNTANETKYFYQDLDSAKVRLNGKGQYRITFAKGQLPPVRGFWSLTLYDDQHFFVPNAIGRYSLGTKSKQLKYAEDGSVTLYLQSTSPGADKSSNWIPAPAEGDFSLMLRAYWPDEPLIDGRWTPPAVVPVS